MGLFSLNLKMSQKIAQAVRDSGGRVFYVGGYVRDKILGRQSKDIDIEIHGVTTEALCEILSGLGEVLEMGASFGILGLRHYSLDIVLPRSIETGEIDPFIGPKEAARRRDFTINALMMDVLTGEVLDFFGGLYDIEHGLIRHVDDYTFLFDKLRVLRAARFSALLGFDVDNETRLLCSSADISDLAVERVFGEVENVLTKSIEPSRFFTELERMKQISFWFPEIRNVNTDILDKAVNFRQKSLFKTGFMFASLCHGLAESETARFVSRLTNDKRLNEYAVNISSLASKEITIEILDASICPDDLALLSELVTGRSNSEILALYHSRMSRPYVTGADILREGVKPGPIVGKALRLVHELRLSGASKDVQLREAMRYIRYIRGGKEKYD
ncbi:MAG: CCA tRNA nucleotidyltransferase [Synergistaceae bacterium]|nr:CCA tRNA nucleotidyltransferase [Synergistaceae bacterium]